MKHICKIIISVSALPAVFLASGPAFAQWGSGQGPGYMHSPWGNMMGGWGWIGMIFTLLFFVLVIVALIMAIRWMLQGKRSGDGGDSPTVSKDRAIEILMERYSRGEIGREEFEQKKKDLS